MFEQCFSRWAKKNTGEASLSDCAMSFIGKVEETIGIDAPNVHSKVNEMMLGGNKE